MKNYSYIYFVKKKIGKCSNNSTDSLTYIL